MDEELAHWENRNLKGVDTPNVKKTFEKLVDQITIIRETHFLTDDEVDCYFEDPNEAGTVWKWRTKGRQKQESQPASRETKKIIRKRQTGVSKGGQFPRGSKRTNVIHLEKGMSLLRSSKQSTDDITETRGDI
ncbi:hypothetical protein R1sor_011631 [Riccia sorocarpa]|uniref:Uncharacterized protein n=1 Tax=Riccia sorocarpa TaxID=122646 RepID=A0ABD3I527_9MARC